MTAELTRAGAEPAGDSSAPGAPPEGRRPPRRPGHRRRPLLVATAAVGAVAIAIAGGLAMAGFDFGGRGAAATGGLPATATAEVIRQDLVETAAVAGTLGYGDASALVGRSAGTVTWLPAAGRRIGRGHTLFEVDQRPVTLMYGAVPMYRTLSEGAEGLDVEQLEQNLRALGYTGFTVDEEFSAATATAVRDWQSNRGLPETGAVDPTQVVFALGAVRIAGRELDLGAAVVPGGPVLQVTGTDQLVTVDLDVTDRTLADKGAAVTVELPDGTVLDGRIANIGTVAESSSDSSTEQPGGSTDDTATIQVIVTLADGASAGPFDEAPVSVNFESERHEDVLTVPVAALIPLGDGGYGVRVVSGGVAHDVPVQTGAYAGGRVEISGARLDEGTLVEVPAA
ncbi:MAG TPA: peptidoglycan-binding protein [Actinomycetes bacterium]|nr:peptidoglycan-binding protein [Actinomycetes bacterium]